MKWLVLVVMMLWAGTAGAQRPDPAADALFAEGKRLFDAGDFVAACDKLEQAYARQPAAGTRGLGALCYEKAGRLASALAAWRDVERLATAARQAPRRKLAAARIAELEPRVARLVIEVAPGDVRVFRDGVELPREQWNRELLVDAGRHAIRAEGPGRVPWSGEIVATDGQRVVARVPALAPVPAEPEPAVVARPPRARDERDERGTLTYSAYAAGGVGVVVLGVATWAGLDAIDRRDAARTAGCNHDLDVCPPEALGLGRDAHARGNLATGLFVAGGALVVAGGVLWYLDRPVERLPRAARLTPLVDGESLGVGLAGEF